MPAPFVDAKGKISERGLGRSQHSAAAHVEVPNENGWKGLPSKLRKIPSSLSGSPCVV